MIQGEVSWLKERLPCKTIRKFKWHYERLYKYVGCWVDSLRGCLSVRKAAWVDERGCTRRSGWLAKEMLCHMSRVCSFLLSEWLIFFQSRQRRGLLCLKQRFIKLPASTDAKLHGLHQGTFELVTPVLHLNFLSCKIVLRYPKKVLWEKLSSWHDMTQLWGLLIKQSSTQNIKGEGSIVLSIIMLINNVKSTGKEPMSKSGNRSLKLKLTSTWFWWKVIWRDSVFTAGDSLD